MPSATSAMGSSVAGSSTGNVALPVAPLAADEQAGRNVDAGEFGDTHVLLHAFSVWVIRAIEPSGSHQASPGRGGDPQEGVICLNFRESAANGLAPQARMDRGNPAGPGSDSEEAGARSMESLAGDDPAEIAGYRLAHG